MGESMRVFVSYRRQDARHVAGRLADRLVERFQVFMDMDTIEPGTDFTDVIRQAVKDCDVFLSVIGPQWMAVQAEDGQRRLDDPNDWVVAETAAALERQVPVIPVLVDGATMPARSELPPALASLASRQAMTIHHESFSSDVNRLIGAIERRLGTAVIPSDPPPSAPVPAVDPAAVQADYTAALAAFFGHRWARGGRRVRTGGAAAASARRSPRPAGRGPSTPATGDLEQPGRPRRERGALGRHRGAVGEHPVARPELSRSHPPIAGGHGQAAGRRSAGGYPQPGGGRAVEPP